MAELNGANREPWSLPCLIQVRVGGCFQPAGGEGEDRDVGRELRVEERVVPPGLVAARVTGAEPPKGAGQRVALAVLGEGQDAAPLALQVGGKRRAGREGRREMVAESARVLVVALRQQGECRLAPIARIALSHVGGQQDLRRRDGDKRPPSAPRRGAHWKTRLPAQ